MTFSLFTLPGMTIKGLKGLPPALQEFAQKLGSDLADRTITPIAQEARQRLEADTPVITGRLLRSTTIRRGRPGEQTLGQFAPYANVVNNRRGFWQGAIQIAQKWPPFYAKQVAAEWGIVSRRYAGK